MAEQFEEKKDNISEEEIKDTASTNEDNNGTVNQDEHTEEAVETVISAVSEEIGISELNEQIISEAEEMAFKEVK